MQPGATPWRQATLSAVDVETTGLDPARDEVISFAAVTIRDGKVLPGETRYLLIRPERMPDAETIRIHGLREVDLIDAPPVSERVDLLHEAIERRALVAHVAAVERGFLSRAFRAHEIEFRNPIIDTAMLDAELRRLRRSPPAEREPIGLSAMARELGLPVHRPHHAAGDALTTAQAFIALATHLEAYEDPLTIGSLVRMSEAGSHDRRRGVIRRLLGRFGS
jgi:DNA polymerase-3 subunit epsilon